MGKNNNSQTGTTDKNLDRLAEFLNHELAQPALAAQIPSGAHVFHGSHNDVNLTRANLRLATDILLSMTLGHLEEAPMIMVFEYEPGGRVLVDLTTEARKKRGNMCHHRHPCRIWPAVLADERNSGRYRA